MDLYRSHQNIHVWWPSQSRFISSAFETEGKFGTLISEIHQASDQKFVDFEFTKDGTFNAVLFWFELNLIEDVKISTRGSFSNGIDDGDDENSDDDDDTIVVSSLTPSLFYLDGEIKSYAKHVVPIKCSHNTVAMQFSVEDADYMHMMKTRVSQSTNFRF